MADSLRSCWEQAYERFWGTFDSCFNYKKTARRAREYVRGLMATLERKNGWQLTEFIGDSSPYAVQNFLSRAIWSADKARDQLTRNAMETLLGKQEAGSLIIDETGFLKKGKHSAGVKRQYSGTAGRIENSQVGVFLAPGGSNGHALIDRELYLPKEWCDDKERRKAAGIPDEVCFHTKQELAIGMLKRAFSSGCKPKWVLADALYGSAYKFRKFLLDNSQAYVVAISKSQYITINFDQMRVDAVIGNLPEEAWRKLSAGRGLKGERWYEWTSFALCWPAAPGMVQYVLARRNISEKKDLAYYFCHALAGVKLEELVNAAGQRWQIESCFEEAKQEVGLDEYEVRSWDGWYRHITMSMIGLLLINIFKSLGNTMVGEKK